MIAEHYTYISLSVISIGVGCESAVTDFRIFSNNVFPETIPHLVVHTIGSAAVQPVSVLAATVMSLVDRIIVHVFCTIP